MAAKKKQPRKSTAPKTKTFLHKEAIFSKETGSSFEALLKAALKKKSKVQTRMQDGSSQGEKRFINYHLLHGAGGDSIFGCEFLGFESGADQSIVEITADADQLNVDAVPAGENKEFLGGSVYFGAKGNHMILFQSMGLRTIELEAYLNWLLRVKSGVIDDDTAVTLQDHISKKKRAKLKGVKGVKFTTPLASGSTVAPSQSQEGESGEMVIRPKREILSGLKNLLGESFDWPAVIRGENLTEISEIDVEVYLRWKGRHGKEDHNDFLDSIATQMRHVNDEIDYEIDAKQGSMTKKKIKLSKAFSVPWTDSGRPKVDILFPKMADWLKELVTDGSVDA